MIEVDCRKCKNLSDNGCSLYGNDADIAVARCAENCFANYCEVKKMNNEELAKHMRNRIEDINRAIKITQSIEAKCFLDGKRKAFQYVLDLLEVKKNEQRFN